MRIKLIFIYTLQITHLNVVLLVLLVSQHWHMNFFHYTHMKSQFVHPPSSLVMFLDAINKIFRISSLFSTFNRITGFHTLWCVKIKHSFGIVTFHRTWLKKLMPVKLPSTSQIFRMADCACFGRVWKITFLFHRYHHAIQF